MGARSLSDITRSESDAKYYGYASQVKPNHDKRVEIT